MEDHSPQKHIKSKVSEFVLEKIIGEGRFGLICKAFSGQRHYADKEISIKIVPKASLNSNSLLKQAFTKEIEILHKMSAHKNPNIIHIHEYFEDAKYCYLVLEYCNGGDLMQYILTHEPFAEEVAIEIVRQLLNALWTMQHTTPKIIHRNLQPDNIMMHQEENGPLLVKIFDFGSGKELVAHYKHQSMIHVNLFTAPEIIKQIAKPHKVYDQNASDIYSLGVLFYFLLFQEYPFSGGSYKEIRE